jgi:hypothetical protein
MLALGHVMTVEVGCWGWVAVLHSHDAQEFLYVYWRGKADASGLSWYFHAGVFLGGALDSDIPELHELLS